MERRVVLTGIGIIAPNGIGHKAFWHNSLCPKSWIAPIKRFDATAYPCQIAGEIPDFNARDFLHPKIIKQTDRSTHMAIACCQMAFEDAGLDLNRENPEEIGIVFANIFGGMEFAEPELYKSVFNGPQNVSAYQAIAWFYAATQGQWSISKGLLGYSKTLVGDRAGGLQAVGWGLQAIRSGECTVAFVGGFEAPIVPYAFLCHMTSGLLSTYNDDPPRAYRPFDQRHTGMVLGEGSGILVLEEVEHAKARGAKIYAEVTGFASTFDAYHPREANPAGLVLVDCIQQALTDAQITPDEVDYISADGLATPSDDRSEAAAIQRVFGPRMDSLPVSAPKAMIGHTLAAAGSIDVAWTTLMMEKGVILPTMGLDSPDPACALKVLDLVQGAPRSAQLRTALCLNRGIGGINTALLVRRFS